MVQNVDEEVKHFCCFICLFGGFLICRFTSERRSSPFKAPRAVTVWQGMGTGASAAEGQGHICPQDAFPLPAAAPTSLRPGAEAAGLVSPLLWRGLPRWRAPSQCKSGQCGPVTPRPRASRVPGGQARPGILPCSQVPPDEGQNHTP